MALGDRRAPRASARARKALARDVMAAVRHSQQGGPRGRRASCVEIREGSVDGGNQVGVKTQPHNDPHDPRAELLLGKSLLGQASVEELDELAALCRRSPRAREARDLIERSASGFRASAVGEEIQMTTADLPDYYRPRELAASMELWFRRSARTGLLVALLLTGLLVAGLLVLDPGWPLALMAGGMGIVAVITLVASIATARRRATLDVDIESGGARWRETVDHLQTLERRYMGNRAKWIMIGCCAATPLLFVASGLASAPFDRFAAYASWVTISIGVAVFTRRRALRNLRNGA